MKNLFTIVFNFPNNTIAIEQYEDKTPLEALIKFIQFSDTLLEFDRKLIEESLSHLHHHTNEKGIWTFRCNNKDAYVTGGTIIQTDKSAYLRPHH